MKRLPYFKLTINKEEKGKPDVRVLYYDTNAFHYASMVRIVQRDLEEAMSHGRNIKLKLERITKKEYYKEMKELDRII